MDGTATVGVAVAVSHEDHVHPSDTSKCDINGCTFTGTIQGSGWSITAAGVASFASLITSGPFSMSGAEQAVGTVANPASGSEVGYYDNTAHVLQGGVHGASAFAVTWTSIAPISCTNQVVTGIPSTGVPACSSVADAMISSASTWNGKAGLGANTFTAAQTFGVASNQQIFGTSTNLTTVNWPASSGPVTVIGPNVASGLSYVAGAAPSAGIAIFVGSTFALTSSTTPALGAATATSLYATSIIDGKATINISTTTPCTLGTASTNCSTVNSLGGYTFNQHATPGTAITYNLPTAAAGLQYCVANSYNGGAANTGKLKVATSASGQFIIFTDGTLSATGGYVQSPGAAGDRACFVGMDTTHWYFYPAQGTWTKDS
jgi:hypothetical protein